jgi:hypothetical protein
MNKSRLCAPLSGSLAIATFVLCACSKPPEESKPAAPSAAEVVAPAAPSPADPELQKKRAQLEYATMEDAYLNDARAQWASGATASSWFGQRAGSSGSQQHSGAANMIGPPDGKEWRNDNQDLGFDSFEVTFAKPVHATAFRAVFTAGAGAVSKVEVKGGDGSYTVVWEGLNEDAPERRGPRAWFSREFARTPTPVDAVKVTIANNVLIGYKSVESAQLIGD